MFISWLKLLLWATSEPCDVGRILALFLVRTGSVWLGKENSYGCKTFFFFWQYRKGFCIERYKSPPLENIESMLCSLDNASVALTLYCYAFCTKSYYGCKKEGVGQGEVWERNVRKCDWKDVIREGFPTCPFFSRYGKNKREKLNSFCDAW